MSEDKTVSPAERIRNARKVPLSTLNDAVLILSNYRRDDRMAGDMFVSHGMPSNYRYLVLSQQTPEQVFETVWEINEATRKSGSELHVELITPQGDPDEDRISYSAAFQKINDHHVYARINEAAEKYGIKEEPAGPRLDTVRMYGTSLFDLPYPMPIHRLSDLFKPGEVQLNYKDLYTSDLQSLEIKQMEPMDMARFLEILEKMRENTTPSLPDNSFARAFKLPGNENK